MVIHLWCSEHWNDRINAKAKHWKYFLPNKDGSHWGTVPRDFVLENMFFFFLNRGLRRAWHPWGISNAHLTQCSMMPDAVSRAGEAACRNVTRRDKTSSAPNLNDFDILTPCRIKILSSVSFTLSCEGWMREVKRSSRCIKLYLWRQSCDSESVKENIQRASTLSSHVSVLLSKIRSTYLHTFCSLLRIPWHLVTTCDISMNGFLTQLSAHGCACCNLRYRFLDLGFAKSDSLHEAHA